MTKKKKLVELNSIVLALVLAMVGTLMALTGCGQDNGDTSNQGGGKKQYFNNEEDPLVFSTLELDKVFNPFYSTSGTDSTVVGMTQIGMMANDANGNPSYGANEAVMTLDYESKEEGAGEDKTTTYYFVLKNNVRCSDGSYLTMKDVLFNLYVYLDPAYTGSSTIYSTDIVGLQEYRTQQASEIEQKNAMNGFRLDATARITALIEVFEEYADENTIIFKDEFEEYLQNYNGGTVYDHVYEDYLKAESLFKEELNDDYSNSMDSYENIIFTDKNKVNHPNLLTTDVEVFLYNEGYLKWNKDDAKLECVFENDVSKLKNYTKEQAINSVFNGEFPKNLDLILQYWNTATTLHEYLTNLAMEEYYQSTELRYENISGIKFANRTAPVTVNGKTYAAVGDHYQPSGAPENGYNEVLSITIKGIDPKAIWNFAFTVAPMSYYSDAEHINKFDYETNFGVEYASQSFQSDVIKDPNKIGVPRGAGAYAASKSSGGLNNVSSGDFYDKGVVYFERNPYFMLGAPKIKKVRFQVVSSAQMLTTLYNNETDYAEPNATTKIISELNGKISEGIGNKSVKTLGYGYIGINAGKVPEMKIRQLIMHCINTQECVNYYGTEATAIYRPMSTESWAYPKDATPYYPYIDDKIPENLDVVNPDYRNFVNKKGKKAGDKFTEAEKKEFIEQLLEEAGFTSTNSEGVLTNSRGESLKYTFTVAGQETDHPAYRAMVHAAEILNKYGFAVTVTTDANALSKLSTGSLTVWAAAWGATIDPDMYQVYHKDSTATSTLNWGYRQILLNSGNRYSEELALVEELSDIIEKARETNNQAARAKEYSKALDLVMQLAVELPTYQRKDLFAYNSNKIDTSTFFANPTSFKGLTSDMWNLSLNVER